MSFAFAFKFKLIVSTYDQKSYFLHIKQEKECFIEKTTNLKVEGLCLFVFIILNVLVKDKLLAVYNKINKK